MLKQIIKFLEEFDRIHNTVLVDGMKVICATIFDNASGHLAYPPDALRASKLNKFPGGKNLLSLRRSCYQRVGLHLEQSFFFEPGDMLYVFVKVSIFFL